MKLPVRILLSIIFFVAMLGLGYLLRNKWAWAWAVCVALGGYGVYEIMKFKK